MFEPLILLVQAMLWFCIACGVVLVGIVVAIVFGVILEVVCRVRDKIDASEKGGA